MAISDKFDALKYALWMSQWELFVKEEKKARLRNLIAGKKESVLRTVW